MRRAIIAALALALIAGASTAGGLRYGNFAARTATGSFAFGSKVSGAVATTVASDSIYHPEEVWVANFTESPVSVAVYHSGGGFGTKVLSVTLDSTSTDFMRLPFAGRCDSINVTVAAGIGAAQPVLFAAWDD